jgi:hypothetical protein
LKTPKIVNRKKFSAKRQNNHFKILLQAYFMKKKQ